MRSVSRVFAVLAVLGLGTVTAVQAQQSPEFEITPYLGIFVPLTNAVSEDVQTNVGPGEVKIKQKTGAGIGGRLTVWLSPSWGVEGGFTYILSDVDAEVEAQGARQDLDDDANLFTFTGRATYRFSTPGSPVSWRINAGLALINHGGDFWDNTDGATDIGLVVGGGIIYDLSPRLALRGDLEDYVYSAAFETQGLESDGKLQQDFLLWGGLSIKLGG